MASSPKTFSQAIPHSNQPWQSQYSGCSLITFCPVDMQDESLFLTVPSCHSWKHLQYPPPTHSVMEPPVLDSTSAPPNCFHELGQTILWATAHYPTLWE